MKQEYDFSQGKRGAIDPISEEKSKITIILDDDVINWFRKVVNDQYGGNYQVLINDILKTYIQNQNIKTESLETMLRRVLREELSSH